MRYSPRRLSVSFSAVALLALASSGAVAIADEQIPDFMHKGSKWKTGLVANDDVVWDKEFATWVAAGEKKAHDTVAGTWSLLVRCTFAHCYSGGFIHELDEALTATPPITNYSANSACRYFETASAYEDDGDDEANWFSYYAFAWKDRGTAGATENPVWTFKEITKRAYNGLITGGVGAISANPNITVEHVQYKSNVADDDLKTGDLKLAILFAGDPERRHINNMDQIRTMLKDKYGFVDANIWIMCGNFGPGDKIPNVAWGSSAKATRAELDKALRDAEGFVVKSVKTYAADAPLNDKKVKLFIWTTDHGTADAPILMSASSDSNGLAGTAVAGQADPNKLMYDAGDTDNTGVWAEPAGKRIDSFSTGNDEVYAVVQKGVPSYGRPGVYFSVDRESIGIVDTDVDKMLNHDFREPAAGVFTAAAGSDNREFVRGETAGLQDYFFDEDFNELPTDDLVALSLVPSILVFAQAQPIQPVFYTRRNDVPVSPVIWVKDPWHPITPGKVYMFWDPAADGWAGGDALPKRIDGLSMFVNMENNKRRTQNPADPDYNPARAGDLKFKPGTDAMVFSVPKDDPFRGSGCAVYRWNGQMMETIYTCGDLGLKATDEVDALHAYVNSPFRSASTPSPSYCPADFNHDNQVDGGDLGMLLADWSQSGGSTDLTNDGVTDGADLAVLLGSWGLCPPPT